LSSYIPASHLFIFTYIAPIPMEAIYRNTIFHLTHTENKAYC
jgi:hypothetical protein